MNSTTSRADLHIHSRHSDRAADWVLRRLDFPASYSDPLQTYKRLKAAGMDFVTLTDHNTISGCLEIAHLPDVIIGEEVTAFFPEDECRVHILVWGISEAQHRQIQDARENIYDMQSLLAAEAIPHAIAHPFHNLNEKLTALHLQKLALLFRHFEGINGRYSHLVSDVTREVFGKLTPRHIEIFNARTGLAPTHEEAWKKVFTGGSDDHGGTHPARAFTTTPKCGESREFLDHVRKGACEAGGESGTPLTLAHSTYSTAFQYAKARLSLKPGDPGTSLLEKIFSRFMEGQDPTEFSLADKLGFLIQGVATGKIFDMAKAGSSSLWKDLASFFGKPEMKAAIAKVTAGVAEPERRAFLMANLISNQLGYQFVTQFIRQISSGKYFESIQTLIPAAPLVGLLSPYIHAFRLPRREWLRDSTRTLCGTTPDLLKNRKRAWFTDTLEDVNGVATTIRKMTAAGTAAGHDITVITCRSEVADHGIPLKNFQPIGEFELPEYELQRLSFPPALQIFDYLERGGFSEIIISTPGPTGLSALAAAKTLGLRTVGIYHTDFPQYVRILTDDSFMETLTWNFMHWFYSQLDVVYVNSEDYRKCWIEKGIAREKLHILPRGLDTRLFHPSKRNPDFWKSRGLRDGETGMLFVGRVSKEKNLDVLVAATRRLADARVPARPLLVGDGPYMNDMKRLLPDAIFTGYLQGEDLAAAYASADIFVFPSTTDTFGNVVLEAQASGIPAIVSDVGGPRDLVQHGKDGFVTKSLDATELAGAIRSLVEDPSLRHHMGLAGRGKVESRDWTEAFEKFWRESPE
ncbi:MAG: glycosyltransferase [Chthoniobacterales bacterium]|nr:glycosyltransferase [Chthoniobacterales bacterium]